MIPTFLLSLLPKLWPLFKRHWVPITLAIALFFMVRQYRTILYERDQAKIAVNNATAAKDSLKLVKDLDSVQVYQQLAWQWEELQATREQLRLKGETKTQTTLTLRPKPKEATHVQVVDTVGRDTLQILQDSLRGPPADVYASVILQGPKAEWSWLVRPTSFDIEIDVGCVDRLKPDVVLRAPAWVLVDSVRTNVQTKVCGDPHKKPHSLGWWALRLTALVGTGVGIGAAVN